MSNPILEPVYIEIKNNLLIPNYSIFNTAAKYENKALHFISLTAWDFDFCENIFSDKNQQSQQTQSALQSLGELTGATALLFASLPIAGTIMAILQAGGIIDLGAFGSIDDSRIACNRLSEWNGNMQSNYINQSVVVSKFVERNNAVIRRKPKCISPSSGCAKEHKRFQSALSLMRENQQTMLDMYNNNFQNLNAFETWYNTYFDAKKVNASFDKTVSNNSVKALALGSLLLFGMGK